LAYGLTVSLACTLLALVLILGHLVRLAKMVFRSAFDLKEESEVVSLFGTTSNESKHSDPQ